MDNQTYSDEGLLVAGSPIPQRMRLSRAKGFRLQTASLALNGLPAMNVARPSNAGNPHIVVKVDGGWQVIRKNQGVIVERSRLIELKRGAYQLAVDLFEHTLATHWGLINWDIFLDRNMACWCSDDMPCHADVWLKYAALYGQGLDPAGAISTVRNTRGGA